MYYSVYNVATKDIRTDFAYWQDKEALKRAFEKHLITVEQITSANSHVAWQDSYSIIETPLLKLKEKDKHNIKAYFNEEIKNVQVGWFNDLKDILDWKQDIERIIEIKTFGFASAWYIILRNNDIPLIIKHKKGYDNNTYFGMKRYRGRLEDNIYPMTEDVFRQLMLK